MEIDYNLWLIPHPVVKWKILNGIFVIIIEWNLMINYTNTSRK